MRGLCIASVLLAAAPVRLPARLVLRDAQAGFAGESGTVLTIERDGRFSLARFLNGRVEAPHARGKLSSSALQKLARAVRRARAAEPPSQADPGPANPHRLVLRIGDRVATLILPPGEPAEPAAPSPFLQLWRTAHDLVARASR